MTELAVLFRPGVEGVYEGEKRTPRMVVAGGPTVPAERPPHSLVVPGFALAPRTNVQLPEPFWCR